MASDSQQKQFLMQFHQLLFNDKLETGTPSEKADILRSIILLLECAHPLKILPFDSPHPLLAKYEEMYARVRDEPASSAESCRWKSSLTLEGVKSMDFMKEFYEEAERRAKQVEASHLKDRPIFKNVQLANQDLPGKGEKIDMHDQNMGPDDYVHYIKGPAAVPPPVQNPLVFGGAPTLAGFSQAHSGVQQGSGSSASESCFSSKWAQYTGNTPGERQPFSRKRGWEDGDGSGAFGQRSLFSGPGHAASKGGTRSGEPSPQYHGNQFPMEGDNEGTASSGGGRVPSCPFRTAAEQLQLMCAEKKFGHASDQAGQVSNASYGNFKKSLGTRRGGPSTRFIPPVMTRDEDSCRVATSNTCRQANKGPEELQDERLRGLDPKLVELIESDIMDIRTQISWKDIAGLKYAKDTMKEAVVLPLIRPDIFSGLRTPTKGLLLFGPPGTGKTLIGKCIASQSMATFFSISASSLTSKYVGEGEKMVKTLFAVARCKQPSVIFIDEIDSLLSHRSDSEHEASRRIKTEFFVQLDGAATVAEDRILVIGATNRPQELDEAAKRRFVKRLYIPLPETEARMQIIVNLMSTQKHCLSDADLLEIAQRTDGYSGADMANLCKEAAMGPIRSIPLDDIENIQVDQVRPIVFSDFQDALPQVRASVSEKDLNGYIEWNKIYGSCVN